jgi:hypothetical protein
LALLASQPQTPELLAAISALEVRQAYCYEKGGSCFS